MADKIFGEGLNPELLQQTATTGTPWPIGTKRKRVNIAGVLSGTRASAQADSTATDIAGLKADFNALLAKLRTAGVIAP